MGQLLTHHIVQLDAILEAEILKLFIGVHFAQLLKQLVTPHPNSWLQGRSNVVNLAAT